MEETAKRFYAEAEKDIALFDAFVEKYNLRGIAAADHICYKCGSGK